MQNIDRRYRLVSLKGGRRRDSRVGLIFGVCAAVLLARHCGPEQRSIAVNWREAPRLQHRKRKLRGESHGAAETRANIQRIKVSPCFS